MSEIPKPVFDDMANPFATQVVIVSGTVTWSVLLPDSLRKIKVEKFNFYGSLFLYYIIIQLTLHWCFSVTDYIKYFAHVTYMAYTIYSIFTTIEILLS